jgi:replication fork clamp-binding protein CrfC/bacterioferritin (cytochrome b1)
MLPQCESLTAQVESLLQLLHQEPTLRQIDTTAVRTSLQKVIAPKFEIVFAGAFSAGKSMLINALLERELLYSAEGHATGTECYIEYAPADKERVVLTFMSEMEIREQVDAFCEQLGLPKHPNINLQEVLDLLRQGCEAIIETEGGEAKSERAKQAKSLWFLLEGFEANRDRVLTKDNNSVSMEDFNFSNLQEAADYARRGKNSAVLKKIEYYCHHPLLKDGNAIIDTPGIDAPVRKDALVAYNKVENPDTSAVVCVFKTATTGELTSEETELLERMQKSPGIRDRVFYVFNRIDATWYAPQLDHLLEKVISSQFRDTTRIYKTSGLLGFHGSQIKNTSAGDRFGLDSIFAKSAKGLNGQEETPQFVFAFNNYCSNSGKLAATQFDTIVKGKETPNENYVRLLNEWGIPLLDKLIQDSGIEEFRSAIIRYLTEEKRPQLFAALADDLQDLCINLKKHYQAMQRELDSQPREIDQMKERELQYLSQELNEIGNAFREHIKSEITEVIGGTNIPFEEEFQKLKARMVSRLDELLKTFSISTAHNRAVVSHRRNTVVPLLAILAEAFYYLSNELEDVLVAASEEVVANFFQRLLERVRKADYYRQIYRLLGNDGGIEQQLKELQVQVVHALVNEAQTECDRYVRERPDFYTEGTSAIWQLRQTLQQTCRSYDYESMKEAEPAIRQLLKLDFDPKISHTVNRTFRATINTTLNKHLTPRAEKQAAEILQLYDRARTYLGQTLDKEAEEKIKQNLRRQSEVESKIQTYSKAVESINSCLEAMQLDHHHQLPTIGKSDFNLILPIPEVVGISNGIVDVVATISEA